MMKITKEKFMTTSGSPIKEVYRPKDSNTDYKRDLGDPGEYPFTRGIHRNLYRGRLWTMRQFAGFGTPEETNRRFKYLLQHGQTGLSVAFDMPTLYGYDSDSNFSLGEVGKCGVAVDSLKDMEIIFDGIPLDEVSTSMTINAPAAILLAMYVAVAEKQDVPREKISGTIQNDILKEYIAQKEFVFPPKPSVKLIVDTMEYCTQEIPLWNTISISGYHIREAGSTAVQELSFTLADGFAYVEAACERGLNVDDFAPRLSFFFNCHNDFFEEIAKFRAARRIWAREMRERFKAKRKRSWWLRFHTQTAGCSLTHQQPLNNIIHTTIQALAAVLGGTQSLHTNSMDEAYALPTENAVKIALRTQQIIAYEGGVANTVDPLGGSYFLETLTNKMEEEAYNYFKRIEKLGGVLRAIEKGFFQKEIASSAYRYQREVEEKERIVVGVNEFLERESRIKTLKIDPEVERVQGERLRKVKKERNPQEVREALEELMKAAHNNKNLMPEILAAVRAYTTLQEMMDILRGVYGEYREQAIF
ncbi:MAG: methylmalonyl-CoA mutase [Candidatus Methanofastidiosia archaeon]